MRFHDVFQKKIFTAGNLHSFSQVTRNAKVCVKCYVKFSLKLKLTEFSLGRLVDAMVLMKDIKVDPNDFATPELVEEVTHDILTSMGDVNFRQVRTCQV